MGSLRDIVYVSAVLKGVVEILEETRIKSAMEQHDIRSIGDNKRKHDFMTHALGLGAKTRVSLFRTLARKQSHTGRGVAMAVENILTIVQTLYHSASDRGGMVTFWGETLGSRRS